MAAGTLTATMARVRNHLREAGISARFFAALVGSPASTVKDALGARNYLGGETEAAYLTVAVRVAQFVKAFEPHLTCDAEGLRKLLSSGRSPEEVQAAVESLFQ